MTGILPPMPLRLAEYVCALLIALSLGAPNRSEAQAALRWQAVLAAGDNAQPVFDNAVGAFKDWLVARGVPPGNIHRLSASPARSETGTQPASAGELLRTIAQLPARPGDNCLVFITAHGEHGRGVFLSYAGEFLTPAALASALAAGCAGVPSVVIVSSCYSGSFAAGAMRAVNRVILTAARTDRPSFGCQADRTYTLFDECLLTAVTGARLWRAVFDSSAACVRRHERQLHLLPSEPQRFFGQGVRDLALP